MSKEVVTCRKGVKVTWVDAALHLAQMMNAVPVRNGFSVMKLPTDTVRVEQIRASV